MTQIAITSFASIVAAAIGHEVTSVKDNTKYLIAKLSDKMGKLNTKESAAYVVLTKIDEEGTTVTLHPAHAKRLITKGEDSGFTMTPVVLAAPEADKPTVEAEPVEPTEPAAPKAPSKKEQFMEVFKAGTAANKARKDIKADCDTLTSAPIQHVSAAPWPAAARGRRREPRPSACAQSSVLCPTLTQSEC